MSRTALGLSYDGRPWQGWQTQPHHQTVQDQLERALNLFLGHATPTICAGRTDSGVHALEQVVHIDSQTERSPTAWVRGLNSFLHESIRVHWAVSVPNTFHARFSAVSRTYRYVVLNDAVYHPLCVGRAGWFFRPLDVERMLLARDALIGQHDFSSFRSSQCQAPNPVRTMHSIDIERQGNLVVMTLTANAFLHHMVRNIVGSLLQIGCAKQPISFMAETLAARNRTFAAPTFAADGLYFERVKYPDELLQRPMLSYDKSSDFLFCL
jgi:tRNA pseudouridine38-40 synthase